MIQRHLLPPCLENDKLTRAERIREETTANMWTRHWKLAALLEALNLKCRGYDKSSMGSEPGQPYEGPVLEFGCEHSAEPYAEGMGPS